MVEPVPYIPTDRRPIASRNLPVFQRLAALLVKLRVSPNAISIASMVFGLFAGALFFVTRLGLLEWQVRVALLLAAGCIQLRLIANLLDGMVAVGAGIASPVGELYNELPDRFSDAVILIGAGYATGSEPVLGYLAACAAIATAYVRALGKTLAVTGLFLGPMAKAQRMATLTITSVVLALLPGGWQPVYGSRGYGLMALAMALIFAGSLLTAVRRIGRIARQLKTGSH